jgi:hypothetical protein
MTVDSGNTYVRFLKEQGIAVISIKGVDWREYSGFMIPAYLPHCTPPISEAVAKEVLKISGLPFVRWDTNFGKVKETEWWYVLKRGPWAIEDIKDKKKRWMIRQGRKDFSVRPLSFDEVLDKCPRIAQLAATRYKGKTEVESQETLKKHVSAAQKVPKVLEYIGCFHGDTLVSFSENYIQNNAVWLETIRHNPAYLNKYSSYGFMDGMLDYYLNQKKLDYVLDGWRSIYHKTQIQDHLIKVFGFTKEYAFVHMVYSAKFGMAMAAAYPFRSIVWALCNKLSNSTIDKIGAMLRQEYIRRKCEGL